MNPRLKTALIIAGLAVAAYLGYRWWENRSGSSGGLGANLNSAAPELIAGSSGPDSGLDYNAGSTTLNITENVPNTTVPGAKGIGDPSGPPVPANYKPKPPIRRKPPVFKPFMRRPPAKKKPVIRQGG